MHPFLLSFGVIFVAELGDKSQLMALALAARYRALPVLIGITLATGLVHALSVALGAVVDVALPQDTLSIAAGFAFLGFAAWTLRGDALTDGDTDRATRSDRHVTLAVAGAFVLAELGDKTMLATVTLATTESAVATWAGSTLGMVAADALAILVGHKLGTRFPERAVRIAATLLFVVFGALLIAEGFR